MNKHFGLGGDDAKPEELRKPTDEKVAVLANRRTKSKQAAVEVVDSESCASCSIKRPRRTKDDIDTIKAAIKEVLKEDHPQTVRQVCSTNWSPAT
jgi:hypothetical protein